MSTLTMPMPMQMPCVWVKEQSGRFYNVKSYWYSPEQNVGAKKEQREKKTYERRKKKERKNNIMHKIPATISCACAAFTAIFAPTALITERPFRIHQNDSRFSIARIACTCKRFLQNIAHRTFFPFLSGSVCSVCCCCCVDFIFVVFFYSVCFEIPLSAGPVVLV